MSQRKFDRLTAPYDPAPRATVAQLKNDIDSGRTGDKVVSADPAMSPLGTDDEAAGTPASPETIAGVRRQEAEIGRAADPSVGAQRERAWFIPTLLAVLLVAAVAVIVFGVR